MKVEGKSKRLETLWFLTESGSEVEARVVTRQAVNSPVFMISVRIFKAVEILFLKACLKSMCSLESSLAEDVQFVELWEKRHGCEGPSDYGRRHTTRME